MTDASAPRIGVRRPIPHSDKHELYAAK